MPARPRPSTRLRTAAGTAERAGMGHRVAAQSCARLDPHPVQAGARPIGRPVEAPAVDPRRPHPRHPVHAPEPRGADAGAGDPSRPAARALGAQPATNRSVHLPMIKIKPDSKTKAEAAKTQSTKQIADNAVKGGPKSVKKDKRAGAGRGQKG